jgi:hypothetical protein
VRNVWYQSSDWYIDIRRCGAGVGQPHETQDRIRGFDTSWVCVRTDWEKNDVTMDARANRRHVGPQARCLTWHFTQKNNVGIGLGKERILDDCSYVSRILDGMGMN